MCYLLVVTTLTKYIRTLVFHIFTFTFCKERFCCTNGLLVQQNLYNLKKQFFKSFVYTLFLFIQKNKPKWLIFKN